MKKKSILKRMSALLCALVVCVGTFVGATQFYASSMTAGLPIYSYSNVEDLLTDVYTNYYIYNYSSNGDGEFDSMRCLVSSESCRVECRELADGRRAYLLVCDGESREYSSLDGSNWTYTKSSSMNLYTTEEDGEVNLFAQYIVSNSVVYDESGNEIDFGNSGEYDSTMGYLQNLTRDERVLRSELYNYYNEDSRKIIWTFDETTTSGLDLTSGDYSVKHYQRYVLCDGYKDEDVIKEGEFWLMGTYDASNLQFEYLESDYEKLHESYGYEGIGFWDSLSGCFHLWHEYFQIVDNESGSVGGYVKITPEGAAWFGGENTNSATTITMDYEVDEEGYVDQQIEESYGSGTTYEEADENAEERVIAQLNGVDSFTDALNSASGSVGEISTVLSNFFDCLPSWALTVFGISVGLAFLLFIIKILRG